ncbi:hypothetical protein HPP92_009482 [Vanilla planifolia]|uniref:Uncharacterized protein n=1 Tax=Vanilla planifolia TaxID=51239 RepID=A0A835V6N5_VANPL|nr:hypothetical protein HPP92_009482 [Vanilla planifolia]
MYFIAKWQSPHIRRFFTTLIKLPPPLLINPKATANFSLKPERQLLPSSSSKSCITESVCGAAHLLILETNSPDNGRSPPSHPHSERYATWSTSTKLYPICFLQPLEIITSLVFSTRSIFPAVAYVREQNMVAGVLRFELQRQIDLGREGEMLVHLASAEQCRQTAAPGSREFGPL